MDSATPATSSSSALSSPPSAILKTAKCHSRRFLVAATYTLICVLRWERELRLVFDMNPLPLLSPAPATTLAACTKEASVWPKPDTLSSNKYESVVLAEEVLGFIITKLDEIDAPVTLMFGTALHEFRNGTGGPCLRPKYNDKDFDIAVFPEHFRYITTFQTEILHKFGWQFMLNDRRRQKLFTTIQPVAPMGEYFQIDIYGFFCNESNDLIFFPWDMVTIARNTFLPLRKHKLILPQNSTVIGATNATGTSTYRNNPGFYMPYDPPCLLQNIYGSDYMTPKSGTSSQAKWGSVNGRPAYDNPKCNSTLTTFEKHDLERQLMFCSGVVPDTLK